MAVSSLTTARIVDAMESDIAPPRNVNPLKNKVVHADIRIQSIEDEPKQDGSNTQANEPIVQSKPSHEDVEYQAKAAEMHMWWDEAIAKNMNLPDGYTKVAVLLIKWAAELDELNTGEEAQELDTLFRDRFHYHTKTVELNVRKKPQHQLNSHVSDFIRDHDGPHNLLVIYYTGHGVYREDKKYLELTASINPSLGKGFTKDARCNWNKAEDKLKDEEVEGDVLTILDTCYSSNLVKSARGDARKFELLSAAPIDQTTARPGQYSFTRALIDALDELLRDHKDSPFSTFRLNQRINIDKRRTDTPSHLWSRVQSVQHNEQHILLAPLKPQKADALQQSTYRLSPKGFLTLRFGLRDASLSQEQIEFMTKTLSKAFHNKAMVGLRRIDWMEIKPAPPITHFERLALVMFVITQWKKFLGRRKEERESQLQSQRRVDEITFPDGMDIDSTNSSQKRHHEGVDEMPEAKRRYLEAAQPPSPPISDSSRIDYEA
ncbi:Nn.00g052340.m01.CDS01 [Neocucurbitaria sp. VM-36]